MQGDGSEANPYLPTTLSEFLSVCNGSPYTYIKLTQDIDAYDDTAYIGELTSRVTIYCQKLYADTPVAIKNVTVRASNMISFRASNITSTCTNVHFLNWVHKKIDNSQTIDWYNSSSASRWNISNCKFSIKIDTGPYYPLIFNGDTSGANYYIYFKYCSFYFEYPENMNRLTFDNAKLTLNSAGLSFTYCNIIIKNLNVETINNSFSDRPLLYLWKLEKTSVIFDTIKIYSNASPMNCAPISYIQNYTDSSVSYSYIAFVDPIITWTSGPNSFPPYIFMTYSNSAYPYHNCLFATSSTRVKTSESTITSGVTRITLEQLKDKEYLEGIGWLP